jgi:predicted lipid-binding transport protein (Tim44 family)
MLEILIYAVIAALIFKKLFAILGQVDENSFKSKPADKRFIFPETDDNENADIVISSAFEAALPPKVRDVFEQAYRINKSFDPEKFLEGAKYAYDLILKAFAKGDIKNFKPLVSNSIFDKLSKETEKRKAFHEKYTLTVVGISSAEIIDAYLNGNILNIRVKFVSEQIQYIEDNLGNLLSGNRSTAEVKNSEWLFSKHLMVNSTIWELVEASDL